VLACAAGAGTQTEGVEEHGVPPLEDLGVGYARVGHVRVDAGGSGPSWAGALGGG